MLHDPGGDGQRRYWSDAGLRTAYAQALTRLHSGDTDAGSTVSENTGSAAEPVRNPD
jgi:hypothetical protein